MISKYENYENFKLYVFICIFFLCQYIQFYFYKNYFNLNFLMTILEKILRVANVDSILLGHRNYCTTF